MVFMLLGSSREAVLLLHCSRGGPGSVWADTDANMGRTVSIGIFSESFTRYGVVAPRYIARRNNDVVDYNSRKLQSECDAFNG